MIYYNVLGFDKFDARCHWPNAVSGFSMFCPFCSLQVIHLCVACLVDQYLSLMVLCGCSGCTHQETGCSHLWFNKRKRRTFGLQAATEVAPTSLPASAFETWMTYRWYTNMEYRYRVGLYVQATCDLIEWYCVGLFHIFKAMLLQVPVFQIRYKRHRKSPRNAWFRRGSAGEARRTWLGESPGKCHAEDCYVVLDFEATCEDGMQMNPQEPHGAP